MPTRLHVSRRLLAAVAAVLLALFGALVLVSWVNGADARARADEQLVPVLVVTDPVDAGQAASSLGDKVTVQQVPKRVAATGSVSSLSSLGSKVANAKLLPGEQLLSGRFEDPAKALPAGTVAAPPSTVEVSIALEPQRAVGGAVKAGDKVGVQLTNATNPDAAFLPNVLVTRTSGSTAGGKADPTAAVMVTLAVSQDQAAVVVRAATANAIWLSLEVPAPGGSSGSSSSTATTASITTGGSK